MYKKYSNKGYKSNKTDQFSTFGDTTGKISLTDLNGWRIDFKLAKFISKDELKTIVRLCNQKRGGKKEDVRFTDLNGFKDIYI